MLVQVSEDIYSKSCVSAYNTHKGGNGQSSVKDGGKNQTGGGNASSITSKLPSHMSLTAGPGHYLSRDVLERLDGPAQLCTSRKGNAAFADQKQRFSTPAAVTSRIGPGHYDFTSTNLVNQSQPNGTSSFRESIAVEIPAYRRSKEPGPGQYTVPTALFKTASEQAGAASSFRSSTRRFSDAAMQSNTPESVAPGTYSSQTLVRAKSATVIEPNIKGTAAFKVRKEKNFFVDTSESKAMPGPTSYDAGNTTNTLTELFSSIDTTGHDHNRKKQDDRPSRRQRPYRACLQGDDTGQLRNESLSNKQDIATTFETLPTPGPGAYDVMNAWRSVLRAPHGIVIKNDSEQKSIEQKSSKVGWYDVVTSDVYAQRKSVRRQIDGVWN